VIHNTKQLANGRWVWRHDRLPRDATGYALDQDGNRLEPGSAQTPPGGGDIDPNEPLYPALWDDVAAIEAPLLLVLGSRSGVVGDDDLAELRRRHPQARIERVEGAGHRVQGDKPVELAALLADFLGLRRDEPF
jgi:pimeloyl-ACP methyl ester carboxylesterase